MIRDSFGAATLAVEVRTPTEEQKVIIQRYASFMHSFLGRGVCKLRGPFMQHLPDSFRSLSSRWNLDAQVRCESGLDPSELTPCHH